MYQKAREASVPLDTIERAIKRGTGELEGVRYEPISYEGYGPGGVAVIVETLTDNRNRTSAEIKHLFAQKRRERSPNRARCRGSSTARASSRSKGPLDEDQLLEWIMEAGAENYEANGQNYTVTTEPHDVGAVRDALEGHGLKVLSADLTLVPQNTMPVVSESEAKKILRLMDAIDDHDDVQNVYANFDIADDLLAAYEG